MPAEKPKAIIIMMIMIIIINRITEADWCFPGLRRTIVSLSSGCKLKM
jgi:hypothetical protein